MGATHLSGLSISPTASTAATLAITEKLHAGKVTVLNLAAAQALTLPAATGSGAKYTLFVGITKTGNCTIKVVRAADTMSGLSINKGTSVLAWATTATSDTITLNGGTQGGVLGTVVELSDVAANKWMVNIQAIGTGTPITPFSATV